MAASSNESQGLKIAVAVFVTLTVILAVTSYFLYSSYARSEGLLASEADKANKARQDADTALSNLDDIRKAVGTRTTPMRSWKWRDPTTMSYPPTRTPSISTRRPEDF